MSKNTLFSYFSKKKAAETPRAPVSAPNAPTPSNMSLKRSPSSAASATATKKLCMETPPQADVVMVAADEQPESLVGKRLKVYWRNDDAWYEGAITAATSDGKHTVLYDDGEEEDVDLSTERYEFITGKRRIAIPASTSTRPVAARKAPVSTKKPKAASKKPKKRKKAVVVDSEEEFAPSDSDSDEYEYQPTSDEDADDPEAELDADDEEIIEVKQTPKKRARSPAPAPAKRSSSASPTGGASAGAAGGAGGGEVKDGCFPMGQHEHDSFTWLQPSGIRDKRGRRPDHPEYNPRTLKVDDAFYRKLTEAQRQWWDVKSENMDAVLFMKIGKFYELYHMDADIGVRELDCIFMKGAKAHSGFPEISYGKFAGMLAERGYRVIRCEQTETPQALAIRNEERKKKGQKKAKVVNREVCSMLTPGTRTYSYLDAELPPTTAHPQPLLVLSERALPDVPDVVAGSNEDTGRIPVVEIGVAVLDASTAVFHLGSFQDGRQRLQLRTFLLQLQPSEVLFRPSALSSETQTITRHFCASATVTVLNSEDELWPAQRTLTELRTGHYFPDDELPPALAQLEEDNNELALSALGGLMWYTRRCLIDHDMLSMRLFEPIDPTTLGSFDVRATAQTQRMVLDGVTLNNLEVLANNVDGSTTGTLLEFLDLCRTPFGHRLFREWLTSPLGRIEDIQARQSAVQDCISLLQVLDASQVTKKLGKMPDLDRLLSRIHSIGSVNRAFDHPESRAVMYEGQTYNVRKVTALVKALEGFRGATEVIAALREHADSIQSPTLRRIVVDFPDLQPLLDYYAANFKADQAQRQGKVVPRPGADPEYDAVLARMKTITDSLEEYLAEQKRALGCSRLKYFGKDKDRFQIEVPDSIPDPPGYSFKSKKKGVRRYRTTRVTGLLEQLMAAEAERDVLLKDQMRRLFARMDDSHDNLRTAVNALAELDCLLSLAEVSSGEGMCRPEFVPATAEQGTFVDLQGSVHPCIAHRVSGFVPNDVRVGTEDRGRMLLLSGPNMGGKSTLLRQTCVAIIMAQMGCNVPATSFRLTPVDRIFTRIGASDRILQGQSTFFVELSETANVLNHATRHSFVILDELGRGTSTFDGTAIAHAVIQYLSTQVDCRTMFATHYHSLIEEHQTNPAVSLGNMQCVVDPNGQDVTFLYKLQDGVCPKSYGINVARLARLPQTVVTRAQAKSEEFEQRLLEGHMPPQGAGPLVGSLVAACAAGELDAPQVRNAWSQARSMIA